MSVFGLTLAESLGRPGLLGIVGATLEKKFQAQLHRYFLDLGKKVAALKLGTLATQDNVETAKHTAQMKLYNLLRSASPLLKAILQINIYDGMLQGDKIHQFAEADGTNDDADSTPTYLTADEAALYASVRAGELVAGINQTTQERIANAIEQGITDRLGVDGTARLLRQTLSDMAASRARMIASTEMNDAFSEATLRKLNRMDVSYKQWITAGACCDECAENEGASPIPVDDVFPSGDDRPPAHPNCRCALSGARSPVLAFA